MRRAGPETPQTRDSEQLRGGKLFKSAIKKWPSIKLHCKKWERNKMERVKKLKRQNLKNL